MEGKGLSCLQLYYRPYNICSMSVWFHSERADWVRMESRSRSPSSLPAMIYSALNYPDLKLMNPLVSHSIKIWTWLVEWLGANPTDRQSYILSITLWFHHSNIPSMVLERLIWGLIIDRIFPTFHQLQEKSHIPDTDFFRYLQVRSLTISILSQWATGFHYRPIVLVIHD